MSSGPNSVTAFFKNPVASGIGGSFNFKYKFLRAYYQYWSKQGKTPEKYEEDQTNVLYWIQFSELHDLQNSSDSGSN